MKPINPTGRPPGIGPVESISGSKPPVQPAGDVKSRPAGDRVNISPLSDQLRALEKQLTDVSVVDTARVEAIKQAISEGRFNVSSDVVADRLIATVKEYLVNQKS